MKSRFLVLLSTEAYFNQSNQWHNQSLSALFGQILNAVTIKGFGVGDTEILRPSIQVIFVGERLVLQEADQGQEQIVFRRCMV